MKLDWYICTALVVVLATASGCANTPDRTPLDAAFAESGQTVEESLARAGDTANDRDSYELLIRYNAPHCGAPSFEILAFGRWTRVFLDGREDMLNQLEDALVGEDPNEGLRVAVAVGAMVGERETQKGLEFPVFEVESYEAGASPE